MYAIRYGDTVEQSTSTFPARFAPMILANRNVWGGGGYIIGANRAEKVQIVFSTVSPYNGGIKINEQNKSIGILKPGVKKAARSSFDTSRVRRKPSSRSLSGIVFTSFRSMATSLPVAFNSLTILTPSHGIRLGHHHLSFAYL